MERGKLPSKRRERGISWVSGQRNNSAVVFMKYLLWWGRYFCNTPVMTDNLKTFNFHPCIIPRNSLMRVSLTFLRSFMCSANPTKTSPQKTRPAQFYKFTTWWRHTHKAGQTNSKKVGNSRKESVFQKDSEQSRQQNTTDKKIETLITLVFKERK